MYQWLRQLQESFVRKALNVVQSVFSGDAKDAAATIKDLKQLQPKEASQITLQELQYYASIVRPCLPCRLDSQSCRVHNALQQTLSLSSVPTRFPDCAVFHFSRQHNGICNSCSCIKALAFA